MRTELGKLLFGFVFVAVFSLCAVKVSAQMAAIAAIDEPEPAAEASGSAGKSAGKHATQKNSPKSGGNLQKTSTAGKKPKATTSSRSKPMPSPPPPPPTSFNGPVLGDKYTFLNFEVVSAEKPYYTRAAKASGAKGLVQVEVLVNTDGSVISAKPRTGNKELWPEAERAALASKLKRPTAEGRPARALGFLVYRFGPAED
ncbi:MAG: hypothetical protein ABL999_11255 [Pyrinomonadaceae bacterium]